MSFPHETLYSLLTGDPTVSGAVAGKIGPTPLPENTGYPAITYSVVATDTFNQLSGFTDLRFPTFQVDVWSRDLSEALTVASGVETALNDGANTLEGRYGTYEPDARLYREIIEVRIPHKQF